MSGKKRLSLAQAKQVDNKAVALDVIGITKKAGPGRPRKKNNASNTTSITTPASGKHNNNRMTEVTKSAYTKRPSKGENLGTKVSNSELLVMISEMRKEST